MPLSKAKKSVQPDYILNAIDYLDDVIPPDDWPDRDVWGIQIDKVDDCLIADCWFIKPDAE